MAQKGRWWTLALVLALPAVSMASIVNRSFEDTPGLAGWATGGQNFQRLAGGTDGNAFAGATIQMGLPGTAWLSQTFALPNTCPVLSVDVLYLGVEGGGNDFTATVELDGNAASARDFFLAPSTPIGNWDRLTLDVSDFCGQDVKIYFSVTAASTASMSLWVDNILPEPASAVLLIAGVAALACHRRRG